jgi:hypothetical protein
MSTTNGGNRPSLYTMAMGALQRQLSVTWAQPHMVVAESPTPHGEPSAPFPLSKEEIEDIFLDLQQKFGFQRDSMRNMVRFE